MKCNIYDVSYYSLYISSRINMINDQPQQEVEPQPQPQQELEPQPQPQPQPRKKRTTTRPIDHKEPQEVDFNNIGQHVGKKQSKFANECGVITRSMISVEYTSWKKVPIAQEDMLWSTIKKQKRWSILNDNRKKDYIAELLTENIIRGVLRDK
ncbi:unnamed protein product [Lactuca virosa]|uniref:No apical meristem-associated C-terminal domain-containing protein n=1 Tax=Lactuca virosa TaxID=75947 RepID=A0AAU9M4M6_9ASTR|nr:unnamed protein product [Lactuca virosa]